jgi:transcriptional regulator with XRE-family HTH domain
MPIGSARTRVLAQVGYRIGIARYDRGLNWAQLATLAGTELSSPQIEGLEAGERDVQLTTLIRIAQALEVRSIDCLLGPMPIENLK